MIKTRLTEMFGVETPICMGGMTGVGYGELVAAVANAGALGFITAHMFPSGEALLAEIEKTKALTDKPGLTLTVVGSANLDAERNAYQRERLNAQLLAERQRSQPAAATPATATTGTAADPAAAATELTGPERVRWLTALYKRTDMPKPRNALGLAKDLEPDDMEALLLTQITANTDSMQTLATQRAVAVRDHLARLNIPLGRLFLGAPGTPPAKGDTPWQPSAELKLGMP